MLVAVSCPFCETEMAQGWVAAHGPFRVERAWLTWEPAEIRTMKRRWRDIGRRGAVTLLGHGLLRRDERAAALCHACGAVVIDPITPRGDPASG
jgi:hypothetical protein